MKIKKLEILVNHGNEWITPNCFIFSEPDGGIYYTTERFGEEFYAKKELVRKLNPFNNKPFPPL